MMEAVKYVLFAAGFVSMTMLVVFIACFVAWLFEKWRNEK